jgi:hypothetical protein
MVMLLRVVVLVCVVVAIGVVPRQIIVILIGIVHRLDHDEREDQSDEAEFHGHLEERKKCVCVQTCGRENLLVVDPP